MYFNRFVWWFLALRFPVFPLVVCFLLLRRPWDFTFLFLASTVSFLQTETEGKHGGQEQPVALMWLTVRGTFKFCQIYFSPLPLTSCWEAGGGRASWGRGRTRCRLAPRPRRGATSWCWPCRSCCTACPARSAASGCAAKQDIFNGISLQSKSK